MYNCEQCDSECVVVGDMVICNECNYEVTKDSLDKADLLAMVESLLIPSMVMLDDLEATMPSRIRFERMETHKKAKALLDAIANA